MIKKMTHITILVKDQDQALKFYTEKLGFEIHTDAKMEDGTRWLTLVLPGQIDLEFSLLKPETKEGLDQVGKQGGVYGIGIFETDDCNKTYELLKARGVDFIGEPTEEPWGIGVTFKDLYGNQFYLNQEISND
jgi:catechol 2,3-dioxygenase-like lactoylglutathione lyase family enzyme